MFNKTSSFNLMFGGEQFTQDYSCSKVLSDTPNEAMFQLFSQSQVRTRCLKNITLRLNHATSFSSVLVHTNVCK